MSFDMEMYLTDQMSMKRYSARDVSSDANYLAQGSQVFYGLCENGGRYRLQQSDLTLPPLIFRIVDALTDGPYSLGDDEFELLRKSRIQTYSGNIIVPLWLSTVSREVDTLSLNNNGTVSINKEDCNTVPSPVHTKPIW